MIDTVEYWPYADDPKVAAAVQTLATAYAGANSCSVADLSPDDMKKCRDMAINVLSTVGWCPDAAEKLKEDQVNLAKMVLAVQRRKPGLHLPKRVDQMSEAEYKMFRLVSELAGSMLFLEQMAVQVLLDAGIREFSPAPSE